MHKQLIIINDICKQCSPGKKQLQKLMYLMERYGIDLNLNYSIHFYGPYSSRLDYALHAYESMGLISITISGSTHLISMQADRREDIDGKLNENDLRIEQEVMRNYKHYSAQDLEALTTIDYVAHSMFKDCKEKDEVLKMVKFIKGDKFSDSELNQKYDILIANHLIK